MDKNTAEFVIYIINKVANICEVSSSKVYKALESVGCIDDYLVDYYDILHTMSAEHVAYEVLDYAKQRGVSSRQAYFISLKIRIINNKFFIYKN